MGGFLGKGTSNPSYRFKQSMAPGCYGYLNLSYDNAYIYVCGYVFCICAVLMAVYDGHPPLALYILFSQ